MLKSPRRLPRRFNRRVTSYTDRLVRARHQRHRKYAWERFVRLVHRAQRKASSWRKYAWVFFAALGVGVVVLAVTLLFFSPIFTLREIRVRRSDQRIEQDLVQVALRPLLGRHLLFFSSSEVVPLLSRPLPRIGRSAVPDVASAVVRKDFPSSITVDIALDPLIARLAIVAPGGETTTQLTETGAAVPTDYLTSEGAYAPYLPTQVLSGAQLPVMRIVDWSARPQPWQQLFTADFLARMQETEVKLQEEFKQKASERTVFLRAREYHLKMPAYELWFDAQSSVDEMLERYRLFLKSAGAGAAKRYVDLRLRDRIVYR